MKSHQLEEIKKFTQRPGLTGSFVHGELLSLTHWALEEGAILAKHSHPHEQISFVISGKMQFDRQEQEPLIAIPGSFVIFSPNEEHGGIALEESIVVDAFSPVREDFKEQMEEK